jgi:hypothetical protein
VCVEDCSADFQTGLFQEQCMSYVGVVYTVGMCMYMSDNCLSLLTSHKHAPNARHDRHHRDPPLQRR